MRRSEYVQTGRRLKTEAPFEEPVSCAVEVATIAEVAPLEDIPAEDATPAEEKEG